MNQILETQKNNDEKKKFKTRKKWFKFQLFFSISIILISIIISGLYFYNLKVKENLSNRLIDNYSLSKLYSNDTTTNEKVNNETNSLDEIFCFIDISKIDLYYPVFSNFSEELLKISPCKISGDFPNINGNLCIAGHNYDNSLFFSNLNKLSIDDEIYIIDNNNVKYIYYVFDIYEVKANDLSPIYNYDKTQKTLTLITCNNFNSNRIIIKAKQKSL